MYHYKCARLAICAQNTSASQLETQVDTQIKKKPEMVNKDDIAKK